MALPALKQQLTCDYDGVNALTAVHVAACLLKPSVIEGYDRLFDRTLDMTYLKRINKIEQLKSWQALADKVILQFAAK